MCLKIKLDSGRTVADTLEERVIKRAATEAQRMPNKLQTAFLWSVGAAYALLTGWALMVQEAIL